jgi:hypothetical protein
MRGKTVGHAALALSRLVLPRPSANGLSAKQVEDTQYGLIKAEQIVKAGGPVPVSSEAHNVPLFIWQGPFSSTHLA